MRPPSSGGTGTRLKRFSSTAAWPSATSRAGGHAAAHARAGLGRPGAGLQALVDGAEVVDLACAALGVVRHAARSSLGGRGITHASYTTMARNTSFMSPKFTARTR